MTAAAAIGALARRAVSHVMRQPAAIGFAFALPLALLAIATGALRGATRLPGFPSGGILDFVVAGTFVQGTLFAAVTLASGIAHDLESGFARRLALSSARRGEVLAGYAAGVCCVGAVQTMAFLAVALIAGAELSSGVLGGLVLVGFGMLVAMVMTTWGAVLAYAVRSEETVLECFPLLLFVLYASSALLPRPLIAAAWFRTIADLNPFSYVIEGIRELFIGTWAANAVLAGAGAAAGLLAAGAVALMAAVRWRGVLA